MNINESQAENSTQQIQQELQDAGSCLAMGAGVGTVGTASALLLGARPVSPPVTD